MSWLKMEDIPINAELYRVTFKENGKKHFLVNIDIMVRKLGGLYKTYKEVGSFSIKYTQTSYRDFSIKEFKNIEVVLHLLKIIGINNKMSTIFMSSGGWDF